MSTVSSDIAKWIQRLTNALRVTKFSMYAYFIVMPIHKLHGVIGRAKENVTL